MQFQSLLSLWFGLTLPVIVLMYMLKRKYIDTVVPSHLLWNRVLRNLEANSPWQKLRNHLLLLLQLLIAALLVLALMQPFVWGSGGPKNHIVIVLDRSFSMETLTLAAGGEGEPQSRLEQSKRDIIRFVNKEASGSAVTLIAMGGQPDVLVSRETKEDAIRAALDGIPPFYGKTAYKETMSLAAALTQEDKESEIRVFTDGQWTETPAGLSFNVPVKVMRAGQGDPADNVRVVQFGVKQSPGTGGASEAAALSGDESTGTSAAANSAVEPVHAVATLKNEGKTEQELDIEIYSGSSLEENRSETLQPGEQKTVFIDKLKQADYYKLALHTNDALAADNQAFAFLPGGRTKKVLLVSEGNVFLEKALQLSHAEVTKVQPGGVSGPLLVPSGTVDLVVLDSVQAEAVSGTAWQELLAEKPVWYIRSPEQTAEVNAPAAEYHITDHPVTQYIRLQDTHIAKLQQTEVVPWGKPVITLGSYPLVYAGSDNGQPRLLFTFDLHQSDLPLRSEFPVLVQNAVEWLGSRQAVSLGRAVAGERIDIPLSGKTASAEWLPLDIVGDPLPAIAAETAEQAVTSSQAVPNRPGLYLFVEHAAAGSEQGSSTGANAGKNANASTSADANANANASADGNSNATAASNEGTNSGSGYKFAGRQTYLEVTADPKESAVVPQQELVFAVNQGTGANDGTQPSDGSSPAANGQPSQQPAQDSTGSAQADPAQNNEGQSPYSLLPWIVLLVTVLMLVEWGVYRRGTSI